ncbi:CusA/CzcA family heavy metal efflux RND transporter [soil metagenome]
MLDKLIAVSIRQRSLVFLLSLVFAVVGGYAATKVPIDAVPDVTNVQVQVITAAPALGPVDVEQYISFPVETAMAGIPGVEEIRSMSRPGISVVTVVFDDSTDLYFAREQVNQRLSSARESIPVEYGSPALGPISSGLGEVLHFEVRSEGCDERDGKKLHPDKPCVPLMDRRTILDWEIAPQVRLVPGVVEVNTFGGEAKAVEIDLDPARLQTARIGVSEVIAALEKNHLSVGGAYMTNGRENVTIHGEARIKKPEDLNDIIVANRGDRTPLYLRDLGAASYAPKVRYGAVTRDGRGEAVVGIVMMLIGANSGAVVDGAKEELKTIQKAMPPGVTLEIYYDRTDLVHRTIHTVSKNLIEASLLVIFVLFVTLANLRAGALVALAIPLALLGVFLGMWVGGVSGNLLSLGAIDFGLVVDGAIIIVEAAQRHLAEKRTELGRPLTDGERRDVVLEATREVRSATAFGEAIIALVYVPILALQSVEGRMFRPMALTVMFALAAAFVLSLTLVPALASILLSRDATDKPSPLLRVAQRLYDPTLVLAIRHPRTIAFLAVLSVAGSLAVFSTMGREFLPKLDEGTLVIPSIRLPSVSLEESLRMTTAVETALLEIPEVTSVVCRTGRAEVAVDPMGINMTDIYVLLKPREEWTSVHDHDELVAAVDKKLSERVPGLGLAYSQPIEMNTNDLLAGIESDVAVHIYGPDLTELRQRAEQTARVLRAIPGATDVRVELVAGANVLNVEIDRQAAARNGLDAQTIMDAVRALGGVEVGTVVDGIQRLDLQVRWSGAARRDVESIESLPILTPHGSLVPLGQVAHVSIGPGPAEVNRERLSRRITVQANVRGRDLASFVETAQTQVDDQVKLDPGYWTEWAGEYERLSSATARLLIVVPIALSLIVVLLVVTFGRAPPALLIFLNIPIAVSGGIFALAIRGMEFSISAGVGMIALFGVAVLNGLVLVTSIERLRAQGHSIEHAVSEGARTRLRPVLTTALVASLGFLPMMLASGAGAEVQRPLATVVVGGIVSSTLLTLLVLPSLYGWLFKGHEVPREHAEATPE